MTHLTGILLLTFRELWAKRIVTALFVISTLVWIFLAFAMSLDTTEGFVSGLRIFGQDAAPQPGGGDPMEQSPGLMPLERFVFGIEAAVAGASYWIGTLLALFATAPLLSGLLERGRIELLLSKPIGRPRLLVGHLLGVLLMMLALATYLIGAVWLVLSIKTGIWNPRFLTAIAVMVGMFGVIYSIIVFMGVWTKSTALALIAAYGVIFLSTILAAREQIVPQLSDLWRPVFLAFYHVLPNFSEVTGIVAQLSGGDAVASWYPLVSSLLFGVVLFGAATVWFARRDF